MPMKEWRLLGRDLWFYLGGHADVTSADWRANPSLYPADWVYQLDREGDYFAPKDAQGIPVRVFRGPLGAQYLPSRIFGYGLAHWNRAVRRGDTGNCAAFVRVVAWLMEEHVDGRIEHRFPLAGMPMPWISCISQGEAISVLTRAHHATGDARYLQVAERALHWLMLSEVEGGLRSALPDGSPFMEEYPGTEYRHVLNGCLYALVGVRDLIHAGGAGVAGRSFYQKVVDGLADNLDAWDVAGWSTYDFSPGSTRRVRNLNTMTYQCLQSILLRYIADDTGDVRLRSMAERWERSAQKLPTRLGALGAKLAYRLVARW
jgi:heparosan-N-sulfate-glucuronate 5-epimerase